MSQVFFEDIAEGAEITAPAKKISMVNMLQYAAATWNMFLLHVNKEYAQSRGFEDANIAAPHYGALLATMLTRWMGDRGRLRKLSYQVRRMGFPNDVLTCKGKVLRKYQVAGEGLVDLELGVENRRYEGMIAVPGTATVSLPRRAA